MCGGAGVGTRTAAGQGGSAWRHGRTGDLMGWGVELRPEWQRGECGATSIEQVGAPCGSTGVRLVGAVCAGVIGRPIGRDRVEKRGRAGMVAKGRGG